MKHWSRRGAVACLLLPAAGLFFALAALRRLCYRLHICKSVRLPVPVVVVGNIVAGGSGKTPAVLALAQQLAARGRRPGIVSRGYGGDFSGVAEVLPDADARQVGDEPLLLKLRARCPVFVGRDRVAAARALLHAHPACDVILSDDGLQHYRLARDVEIAVVDAAATGNRWPLPAGPLREPVRRLQDVDAVIGREYAMHITGACFVNVADPARHQFAEDFSHQKIAAVAGIGQPQKFFAHLTALGLKFEPHVFPDHHRYSARELDGIKADAILTTEKDAVKLRALLRGLGSGQAGKIWHLPVAAHFTPDLAAFVLEKIDGCTFA